MPHPDSFISQLRRFLAPSASPIQPPPIPDPITRLVHIDIGLPELFATRARENGMEVSLLHLEDLLTELIAFLHSRSIKTIAVSPSAFLDMLQVFPALKDAGFDIRPSTDLTLDQLYDIDCSITDVHYAVAEVGGLVLRASPTHPRGLSLIPPIHVAILQPKDFLADLVDLFEALAKSTPATATSIITGPSKTADIEMNIVIGVHGPRIVGAFILQ